MLKKVISKHVGHDPHMVGDGLPVRNVFSYTDLGKKEMSPFLMLDYGMPSKFPPTEEALGVGMHPHRGFETVTFVYQGELEHRDTAGNQGEIGPGDVQWMTAGSGVLHEELHAKSFRKTGGTLQMAQLWVNLPADKKMTAPKYQTLMSKEIPVVTLPGTTARLRVVAGSYGDAKGPASTFTPLNLWDVELDGGAVDLKVPEGYTTAVFVAEGSVTVDGTKAGEVNLVVLEREGTDLRIEASGKAHVIILNGEPINEPVVGYGPFVMNTQAEITQAMQDYSNGTFARAKQRS